MPKLVEEKQYHKDVAARDMLISRLYLRGYNYMEIVELMEKDHNIKLDRDKVYDSMQRIRKQWKKERPESFDQAIDLIVQRLNYEYREAEEAWQNSKRPTVTDSYEPTEEDPPPDLTTKEGIKQQMKLVSRDIRTGSGDPRFLDVKLSCLQKLANAIGVTRAAEQNAEVFQPITFIEVHAITRESVEAKVLENGK